MSKGTLDEIVEIFYMVSGMDISVVDSDFHSLSVRRNKEDICTLLHRERSAIDKCRLSDIEQLSSAKETLSPILYSCPFGITEVIVPIIRDGDPVGYIIAAIGIKKNEEQAVRNLCINGRSDSYTISEQISSARKLTDEEVSAYFETLKIFADYIANDPSLISSSESIGHLIKKYIKDNITRKLTLHDLAKNLHCSTVTLTEHFKREFGITINDYIVRKRMDLAEKLLLTTNKPLREVAVLTGFADVEYFSRTFKKYHSISPASWRRERGKTKNDNT